MGVEPPRKSINTRFIDIRIKAIENIIAIVVRNTLDHRLIFISKTPPIKKSTPNNNVSNESFKKLLTNAYSAEYCVVELVPTNSLTPPIKCTNRLNTPLLRIIREDNTITTILTIFNDLGLVSSIELFCITITCTAYLVHIICT